MLIKTGKGTITLTALVAIWSISAIVSLPGLAVSPILDDIDKIFPKAGELEVSMLESLPSLMIIPFMLLAGRWSVKRNKIRMLVIGTSIFLLSGIGCMLSRTLLELIITSTILGIVMSFAFFGFGVFEGVQYQMGVNAELEYSSSFFMNIARLTSLPFLHAIWCAIAGYFISFANLYPKYRISLYFLAIAIPAVIHGLYDTFCGSYLGMLIALPITFTGVIMLMTYLKQGVNYQSKLRN